MKRYWTTALAGLATLACVAAAGLACGSSEESPASTTPDASRERMMSNPQSEAKQKALDALAWKGVGEPRDKTADSTVCEARVDSDPALRGEEHGLVKLQRWLECMESYGWKRSQG